MALDPKGMLDNAAPAEGEDLDATGPDASAVKPGYATMDQLLRARDILEANALSPAEVTAMMMERTIDDMIAQRLHALGLAVASIPSPEVREALGEQLAEADGRIAVTVRLQPVHHGYLVQRAAAFGETPERMLETILREYRRDDRFRPGQNTGPSEPGHAAGTSRR